MNLAVVVNVTAMALVAACLASSAVVRANSFANRYGKQQLAQKQNRYGNAALSSSSSLPSLSWFNGGAGNRIAAGWTSPYGGGGGNLMRHYPVSSMARYPAAMMVDSRQGGAVYADDYYDGNAVVSPYDPRLQLLQQYDGADDDDDDRSDDYAVVRYPSYGAAGYYPLSEFAAYDTAAAGDDVLYDDMAIVPSASYYLQPSAAAAAATAAVNRYDTPPPPPPPRSPLSLSLTNPRYEPAARHPTDKIHKFRKVFMSNVVSPSNAFKSTKEQQLYDFWESLVNDRGLDGMRMDDAETAGQRHQQPHLQGRHAPVESSDAISQLYQHLPPIFQQLLHKQQQQQQQQQQQTMYKPFLQHQPQTADERPSSSPSSSSSSSSSSLSLASPSHAAAPTGNHYKQWANGSPLIKRGMAARRDDYDDVRQLEKLKTRNATAAPPGSVTTTTTTTTTTVAMSDHVTTPVVAPMMADGGQREYVLPRPAGEKSGIESLLEVIAEGGLKGHLGQNSYSKIREEAKVNKKRSFVSDETSLAAQLGALRKN